MTVEQKAKRFCKNFVFTYIIPSYNETKRKSGALIAEESFIAGYNECEKETIRTDNTETLQNALKRIEELEAQLKAEHTKGELDFVKINCNSSCKKIAELERKLKVETELSKRLGIAYREYEQLTKEQDEYLDKLEQENTRLKLELEALDGQIPWKDIKDKSEVLGKLTEAKELLKRWVELFKPKLEGYPITPIQEQTENFLKGE